jgi:hypothetical protein
MSASRHQSAHPDGTPTRRDSFPFCLSIRQARGFFLSPERFVAAVLLRFFHISLQLLDFSVKMNDDFASCPWGKHAAAKKNRLPSGNYHTPGIHFFTTESVY